MTRYVILRADPHDAAEPVWEEIPIGTVEASSPRRALSAANVGEGEYVAVPARSWKPLTVKVEQTTKVTIS